MKKFESNKEEEKLKKDLLNNLIEQLYIDGDLNEIDIKAINIKLKDLLDKKNRIQFCS